MTTCFRISSWRPPSTHHCGGALDRLEDADVRAAAALETRERVLDLRLAWILVVAQEGRGGHDPAVDAVAALRHLLLDVGGLQWMRLVRRAEACQRRDPGVADRRQRSDARACRLAVNVHRAGAALREPAAEMRVVEAKIPAQGIEQRHVRIGLDGVRNAIAGPVESLGHGTTPWRMRRPKPAGPRSRVCWRRLRSQG